MYESKYIKKFPHLVAVRIVGSVYKTIFAQDPFSTKTAVHLWRCMFPHNVQIKTFVCQHYFTVFLFDTMEILIVSLFLIEQLPSLMCPLKSTVKSPLSLQKVPKRIVTLLSNLAWKLFRGEIAFKLG